MSTSTYQYQALSTREGFNRSLKHFRLVSEIMPDVAEHTNLSDLLNELLERKRLTEQQVPAIVNALLVDKYGYVGRSHNMKKTIVDLEAIAKEVGGWTTVDLLVTYHHPDLGVVVINPKNAAAWVAVRELRRNELVTVYAGAFGGKADSGLYTEAALKFIDLLEGKKFKAPARFKGGKFRAPRPGERVLESEVVAGEEAKAPAAAAGRPKARTDIVVDVPAAGSTVTAASEAAAPAAVQVPAAAPAGPPAKRKMTPMVSIPVTNELFHNGNVEAWKRIIASYTGKYPGLEVFVFYDGERIQDLNTLFKWGKVKHGSTILISVAGDPTPDVPKLRRYLSQGASNMFEAFLRFPVNTILPLF